VAAVDYGMSVYVDDARFPYGRMVMCHMLADSTAELEEIAEKIGLPRKWIQHAGTYREHYDISLSKRRLAVFHGAKEITVREAAELRKAKEIAEKSRG